MEDCLTLVVEEGASCLWLPHCPWCLISILISILFWDSLCGLVVSFFGETCLFDLGWGGTVMVSSLSMFMLIYRVVTWE